MTLNPGAAVLLDEPDAHLEILRQRQTYAMLADLASSTGGQVIAASHSEVILNEAARKDTVVAFLGTPHRIDDRGKAQLQKSLKDIGFEAYYAAEQTGWVLFLEGATDLAILQVIARRLGHVAIKALDRPFVDYVQNLPSRARDRFHGLQEGVPELVGYALFDHLDSPPSSGAGLTMHSWRRNEIENYISQPETLVSWARDHGGRAATYGGLVEEAEAERWEVAMREEISRLVPPVALEDSSDPYWSDVKASDQLLDRLFDRFFQRLGVQNLLRKSNYHQLAKYVRVDVLPPEVREVLDAIAETERSAAGDSSADTPN